MRIAVVGGGIFGVTAAVRLAKENHSVDLFERYDDILKAASGINQYRLHSGYHYPRSKETALSSSKAAPRFEEEFSDAIINDVEHYYCVSKKHSLTSAQEFLDFCKSCNLEFTLSDLDLVRKDSIDLCVRVKESLIDPIKLREICWKRLKEHKVNVLLRTEATEQNLERYDFVIICAYSTLNSMLKKFPESQKNYQFELCEKPVVKLPGKFNKKSIVVLDGPFMCIDPFGRTGMFVMGNVVHAIHQTNIGMYPVIDKKFLPLLDNGIIKNPQITNFNLFIESAAEFIPEIKNAEHVGSMFTIRTVLPYEDATDTRPTIVETIDDRTITIFSGKIGNCVEVAEEVARIIRVKK